MSSKNLTNVLSKRAYNFRSFDQFDQTFLILRTAIQGLLELYPGQHHRHRQPVFSISIHPSINIRFWLHEEAFILKTNSWHYTFLNSLFLSHPRQGSAESSYCPDKLWCMRQKHCYDVRHVRYQSGKISDGIVRSFFLTSLAQQIAPNSFDVTRISHPKGKK